jgi:hypothetical protein
MFHQAVKLGMKFYVAATTCDKLQRAHLAPVMYLRSLYRLINNSFKE